MRLRARRMSLVSLIEFSRSSCRTASESCTPAICGDLDVDLLEGRVVFETAAVFLSRSPRWARSFFTARSTRAAISPVS